MSAASPGPLGPGDSPGFLLWRATLRWQRRLTAALQPLGLTHVQFVLLATVWWLEGHGTPGRPPSQRDVAAHAAVDTMMTSQVVRALEQRGLVDRAADPADARVRRVGLTDAGRRLAERAVTVVEAADAAFFTRVADRDQALAVLRQLAEDGPPGS